MQTATFLLALLPLAHTTSKLPPKYQTHLHEPVPTEETDEKKEMDIVIPPLPGGITTDTDKNMEQEIVNFALSQMAGGGKVGCPRKILKVENFQQQVMSGTRYSFDVEIGPGEQTGARPWDENATDCPSEGIHHCRMAVLAKEEKQVLWDEVSCESAKGEEKAEDQTRTMHDPHLRSLGLPIRIPKTGIDEKAKGEEKGKAPIRTIHGPAPKIKATTGKDRKDKGKEKRKAPTFSRHPPLHRPGAVKNSKKPLIETRLTAKKPAHHLP